MAVLLGIFAGMCVPAQTSINTKLRGRVGSPFYASFISFSVSLVFLVFLLTVTGQGLSLKLPPFGQEPFWIYCSGAMGVIFLTGNILLFAGLGGVQTVVLTVFGQIMTGLLIDTFGLYRSAQLPLTVWRVAGAVIVFAGVVAVSLAKGGDKGGPYGKTPGIWPLRCLGVFAGFLSASQAAINGRMGQVLGSSLKATFFSFIVGAVLLLVISCAVFLLGRGKSESSATIGERLKGPWWMWLGGFLGVIYVFSSAFITPILGAGMAMILVLTGSTSSGLIIDHFGLFDAPVKKINIKKIAGVAMIIAGAAMIRLL
jgi:transporter family-2 protein